MSRPKQITISYMRKNGLPNYSNEELGAHIQVDIESGDSIPDVIRTNLVVLVKELDNMSASSSPQITRRFQVRDEVGKPVEFKRADTYHDQPAGEAVDKPPSSPPEIPSEIARDVIKAEDRKKRQAAKKPITVGYARKIIKGHVEKYNLELLPAHLFKDEKYIVEMAGRIKDWQGSMTNEEWRDLIAIVDEAVPKSG